MSMELMTNKQFAYECLHILLNTNRLDAHAIAILTSKNLCHSLFSCSGFPILLEIDDDMPLPQLKRICKDQTGHQRYYSTVVQADGRHFVVSNHWYGPAMSMPDNRTPFLRWVQNN